MLPSTAGNRKPRPRLKAAVTLIALLAVTASAQALAPAGASAMIDEKPCKKEPSGVWKTAGGLICIVVDGAAIPLEVNEVSGSAPILVSPESGLPQQITPGGRPGSRGEHPHLGGRGRGSGGAIPKVPKKEIWNERMCLEAKAEMGTLLAKIQDANKKIDDENSGQRGPATELVEAWRKRRAMLGDQFKVQGCAAKLEEAKKEKEARANSPKRITNPARIERCRRAVATLARTQQRLDPKAPIWDKDEKIQAYKDFKTALQAAQIMDCIVILETPDSAGDFSGLTTEWEENYATSE